MKAIERPGRAQVTASPLPTELVRHLNPPTVQAERDSPAAGEHPDFACQPAAIFLPFAQLTPVTRSSTASSPVLRQARAVTPVGPSAPLWWASVVSAPPGAVFSVDSPEPHPAATTPAASASGRNLDSVLIGSRP